MHAGLEPLRIRLSNVCFLHWPAPVDRVDRLLPDWLSPDTVDGSAWIGALPMEMTGLDVFGVPIRDGVLALNLRTYVRSPSGDRGVYFLSLDATDRVAVETARRLFRLPYHDARIEREGDGAETAVRVVRDDERRSTLSVTYEPEGPARVPPPDTLPSFLVERYRYFATGPLGTRLVGNVGHEPWTLRSASATVTDRSLLAAVGLDDGRTDPLAQWSSGTEMRVGPPVPVAMAP